MRKVFFFINTRGRANRIERIRVWLYAINSPIIINAEKFSYTPNINLKLKVIENINIAWTLLISTLYLFISIIENTHGFSSYGNWLCRLSRYCYKYME